MPNYHLEQAEKELFAVYQVVYAGADLEMVRLVGFRPGPRFGNMSRRTER